MDIYTKLKLYEEALRKLGVNPADILTGEAREGGLNGPQTSSITASSASPSDPRNPNPTGPIFSELPPDESQGTIPGVDSGLLVSNSVGKSRYLENNLWTSLRGAFRDTKELLQDDSSCSSSPSSPSHSSPQYDVPFDNADASTSMFSDAGALIFGSPKHIPLHTLHPSPIQLFKLWQTFLDNVNPLVKVFHTPTIQALILNSVSDLQSLPRPLEALMFSIYCCALTSLSESECEAVMDEEKAAVMRRMRTGAQQALLNAGFLKTSDLMVLQAFVLFLLSLNAFEPKSYWILTGAAIRIGQRSGLHRDGSALSLPPFETEMRRRLWWQLNLLDGYAEKLAGTGSLFSTGDTKLPSNLNDSDLFPDMRELPREHDGPTEMMFFLIRCHVGDFLRRSAPRNSFDGSWSRLSGASVSVSSKDKAIDAFAELLERKFIRHCDESIPSHFMAAFLGRAVICTMRFIAHNPDQYADKGASMPQSERDFLFQNCLTVISYQNRAFTTKGVRGFSWHVNMHFQWKAFIYLLGELRFRTEGEDAERGWREVGMVYQFHPNFMQDVARRALPVAVGNLTLRAWEARIAAKVGMGTEEEPGFITMLKARRSASQAQRATPGFGSGSGSAPVMTGPPAPAFSAFDAPVAGMENGEFGFQQQPLHNPLLWNDDLMNSLDFGNGGFNAGYELEQMNWTEWDNLLQDFQTQGSGPG